MPPSSSIDTRANSIVNNNAHSLSLKVLRLSRPSLTPLSQPAHFLLPHESQNQSLHPSLSTAASSSTGQLTDPHASLSQYLTLPSSFGAAFVGEEFSCGICVNNERLFPSTSFDPDVQSPSHDVVVVGDIKLFAEMKTPSSLHTHSNDEESDTTGTNLDIYHTSTDGKVDNGGREMIVEELSNGSSRQGIIRFDLEEEGSHVLAVTVVYNEYLSRRDDISNEPLSDHDRKEEDGHGGNNKRGSVEIIPRSFRKLYQFIAQQALGVRTKVTEMSTISSRKSSGVGLKERWFTLEAQIENLAEQTVVLNTVNLELKPGLSCVSLNDDGAVKILGPRDVEQVAFRLDYDSSSFQNDKNDDEKELLMIEGGKYILARVKVDWTMGMGQDGTLKTGWLGSIVK